MVNPKVSGQMNHRRTRRRVAGFSVLEALVAAAVLGIALIALVKLHTSAMRGMKSSRDLGTAGDIALQVAEELAAEDVTTLNANACFLAAGTPTGCRDPTVMPAGYSAPKAGADCTWWVEDGLMRDGAGALPANRQNSLAAAVTSNLPYRIDRVVHADPNATYPNTRIVEVYVCWTDEGGIVKEVQTSRVAGI